MDIKKPSFNEQLDDVYQSLDTARYLHAEDEPKSALKMLKQAQQELKQMIWRLTPITH
ncbi:hypothetical protein [Lonepinella koalarum]|uniref:hypothetical protein n=1 Tax=Lonepinella koalarum TaxID=53417 RepID=UPI0012AADDFD|nr:hypothetical protein [Lonepinella koalarum]